MSPPLPSRYLAQKLSEALPTTDGGVLRTIGDAIAYDRFAQAARAAADLAARVQADPQPRRSHAN
jgi:hypothetical protein